MNEELRYRRLVRAERRVKFQDFIKEALVVPASPYADYIGFADLYPHAVDFLKHMPGRHVVKGITPFGVHVSQEAFWLWRLWGKMHCPALVPVRCVRNFKQAARWAAKRKRRMSLDEFERCFLGVAERFAKGLAEAPPENDPPKRGRGRPTDKPKQDTGETS